MKSKWVIEGPQGYLTGGADTEQEAWQRLAGHWNSTNASPSMIEYCKRRGYRAVRLMDADELRARVEGLECPTKLSADEGGITYEAGLGWDAAMDGVLSLLDP